MNCKPYRDEFREIDGRNIYFTIDIWNANVNNLYRCLVCSKNVFVFDNY